MSQTDAPIWAPAAKFIEMIGSPPFLQWPPRPIVHADFIAVLRVPPWWQPANDESMNPSPEAA